MKIYTAMFDNDINDGVILFCFNKEEVTADIRLVLISRYQKKLNGFDVKFYACDTKHSIIGEYETMPFDVSDFVIDREIIDYVETMLGSKEYQRKIFGAIGYH